MQDAVKYTNVVIIYCLNLVSHLPWDPPRQHVSVAAASEVTGNYLVTMQNLDDAC
jgi:hypothetical protein